MDRATEAILARAERAIGEPGAFTSDRLQDAWRALRRIRFDPKLQPGRHGTDDVAATDKPRPREVHRSRRTEPRRRCYDCKKDVPLVDFHRGQSVCKVCNYARVKKWRAENPEKWHEQDRRRKANNRRRAREARDRAALEANVGKMKTDVVEDSP